MKTNKSVKIKRVNNIKDALQHLSPSSGASIDYGCGVAVGVVSTLAATLGLDYDDVIGIVKANLPKNADPGRVPDVWRDDIFGEGAQPAEVAEEEEDDDGWIKVDDEIDLPKYCSVLTAHEEGKDFGVGEEVIHKSFLDSAGRWCSSEDEEPWSYVSDTKITHYRYLPDNPKVG